MRNVNFKLFFCVSVISLVSTGLIFAGQSARQNQTSETAPAASAALANTTSATEIVDRIVSREQALTTRMKSLHPLVETYLQQLDKDDELAFRPVGDQYFLGKLDFNSEVREESLLKKPGLPGIITGKITQLYSVKYLPAGFAQMLAVDAHFNRTNYDFEYIRREFLGEVRTIVFDVSPKKRADAGPPQTPVEVLFKPKPDYTDEARKLKLEGEVLVHVLFTAAGEVRVLDVIRGLGHGLDENALRAAQQIKFKPAMRDGQPVDSTATVHIVFQLAY